MFEVRLYPDSRYVIPNTVGSETMLKTKQCSSRFFWSNAFPVTSLLEKVQKNVSVMFQA